MTVGRSPWAPAWSINDGQTITIGDGLTTRTFEFEDTSSAMLAGVGTDSNGYRHITVNFNPYDTSQTALVISQRLADAINNSVLDVDAIAHSGQADESGAATVGLVNATSVSEYGLSSGINTEGETLPQRSVVVSIADAEISEGGTWAAETTTVTVSLANGAVATQDIDVTLNIFNELDSIGQREVELAVGTDGTVYGAGTAQPLPTSVPHPRRHQFHLLPDPRLPGGHHRLSERTL